MSISLAITVIIISVNWIAIFRYIRAYIESYMALSSRIERNRTVVRSSPFWSSLVYFFPPRAFFSIFFFLLFSPAIIIPSAES